MIDVYIYFSNKFSKIVYTQFHSSLVFLQLWFFFLNIINNLQSSDLKVSVMDRSCIVRYEGPIIYFFSLSFICWANEHERPVPSGSTFNALIIPSSNNIEYLIDRVPPKTGISVLNSRALVKVASGSDSNRTYKQNYSGNWENTIFLEYDEKETN